MNIFLGLSWGSSKYFIDFKSCKHCMAPPSKSSQRSRLSTSAHLSGNLRLKGRQGVDELGKKNSLGGNWLPSRYLHLISIFYIKTSHQSLWEGLFLPRKTAFCFAHTGLLGFYIYTVFLSGLVWFNLSLNLNPLLACHSYRDYALDQLEN